MFQLTNETPFAAERSIQLDPQGVQHWVVVVKATYRIDPAGKVVLHEQQEPVCLHGKYSGKDGESSLLRETEIAYRYTGTDVIVNATAHAPGGRPVAEMEAHVAVGSLRKSVRVVGERRWINAAMDLVATPPVPFTRMPISYDRAYGGTSASGGLEPRNPIGRGFGLSRDEVRNQLLPNIEDLHHPVRSWHDRPPPAGFGALAGHWSPRRERAGTYDASWQTHKVPLLPDDFDPTFFAAASPGLRSDQPLRGGEPAVLQGVTDGGPLRFALAHEALMIDTWLGRQRVRQSVNLQRVIIEPDDRRLVMVWGSTLRCGTRFREITRTRVDAKLRLTY